LLSFNQNRNAMITELKEVIQKVEQLNDED